jgi:PPIC-type PPIASE domain
VRALAIFFLAGSALFGLKQGLQAGAERALRVHAARDASAVEVERAAQRALLAELGLAAGPPLRDPVIRERLTASLSEPGRALGERALLKQADELGLWHEDAVIEARLAAVGELGLRARISVPEPSTAELLAYRDAHLERFESPERFSFTQLFLARDKHGPALNERAEALRARLIAERTGPESALAHSEPSNLPARVVDATRAGVAARFGAAFADALTGVAPGAWGGPLPSAFGAHLVWIGERRPAGPVALEQVRGRIVAELREQALRRGLERELGRLRAGRALEVAP